MYLKITQKYWTIGDKFALKDENDCDVFYAKEQLFKLLSKFDLYDLHETVLYHMEAKLKFFLSYFVITSGTGFEIGFIKEKVHWPGFRRASMKVGDIDIKIKGGPIHMKAMKKDANGKWDKKHPVVKSTKKLFRIRDIYAAEIDERMIDPAVGALVAIWYDKVRYGHKH